jgi:hypothetical protein
MNLDPIIQWSGRVELHNLELHANIMKYYSAIV